MPGDAAMRLLLLLPVAIARFTLVVADFTNTRDVSRGAPCRGDSFATHHAARRARALFAICDAFVCAPHVHCRRHIPPRAKTATRLIFMLLFMFFDIFFIHLCSRHQVTPLLPVCRRHLPELTLLPRLRDARFIMLLSACHFMLMPTCPFRLHVCLPPSPSS